MTDRIACLCVEDSCGRVLEEGCCDAVFANPACQRLFERIDAE